MVKGKIENGRRPHVKKTGQKLPDEQWESTGEEVIEKIEFDTKIDGKKYYKMNGLVAHISKDGVAHPVPRTQVYFSRCRLG